LKRIIFLVKDPFHARMQRAISEGHYMKISELIRAGITRELDKLGL